MILQMQDRPCVVEMYSDCDSEKETERRQASILSCFSDDLHSFKHRIICCLSHLLSATTQIYSHTFIEQCVMCRIRCFCSVCGEDYNLLDKKGKSRSGVLSLNLSDILMSEMKGFNQVHTGSISAFCPAYKHSASFLTSVSAQ